MKADQQVFKGKRRNAYSFAFLSALTGVVVKLIDAYISRNIITVPNAEDKVVAACVFLTLGGTIGLIVFIVLAHTQFGRILDSRYTRFSWGTVRFQANALIGGVSGAISTGLYLLALQKGYDAATVVALASSQILWILGYEYWKSKIDISLKKVVGPAFLMIAGVWVGEGLSRPSFEVFVLVFVMSALLGGISDVHDKIAAEESSATLATVWRSIYLGITGTALSFIYVSHIDKMSLYVDMLWIGLQYAVPLIALLMTVAFFTNGWGARAKAHLDMGASKVVLISNLKIVGVLLALGALNFLFGLSEFGQLPTDMFLLMRKILGAGVITASVLYLVKNTSQR